MAGIRRKRITDDYPVSESIAVRPTTGLPVGYAERLDTIKQRIATARVKAALAVNRDLIELYWDIGGLIVERQQRGGWGAGVIQRLGGDIQAAFPGITGFSPSNLGRMRSFYLGYQQGVAISAQAVRNLPQPDDSGGMRTELPISAQAARKLGQPGGEPHRGSRRQFSHKLCEN